MGLSATVMSSRYLKHGPAGLTWNDLSTQFRPEGGRGNLTWNLGAGERTAKKFKAVVVPWFPALHSASLETTDDEPNFVSDVAVTLFAVSPGFSIRFSNMRWGFFHNQNHKRRQRLPVSRSRCHMFGLRRTGTGSADCRHSDSRCHVRSHASTRHRHPICDEKTAV